MNKIYHALPFWLIAGLPIAAQAQVSPSEVVTPTMSGTIKGAVRSEAGNPIYGVSVVAIHLPSGIRRRITTDENGAFSLPQLLLGGPYALQVTQPGFRPRVTTNLFLSANKTITIDFVLVPDVVAVGTRRADRSAADALSPVDVVDMSELALTAPGTDIGQILNYVVPSFNSTRQNVSDIADHQDPSSLRGMGVDQMLVLVNGKRFHNMAGLYLLGTRGVGSSGTDVNILSANALDRVEVLRDGAAAQYGSDAIAGVMNFTLKSDNSGGNVFVGSGLTRAGDGLNTTLSLNKGLKLGEKGFLNLTGEVDYRGSTSRYVPGKPHRDFESHPIFSRASQAEEDARTAANGGNFDQINGNARSTNYRFVYNAGVQLAKATRLYSFGGYTYRDGQSRQQWTTALATPNDVVPGKLSALGYQPVQSNKINDATAVVGITQALGAWSLDVSNAVGFNKMKLGLSESVNPSLGAATPTSFDLGSVSFLQNVTNGTVTRLFDKAMAGVNVAFGGEFRTDVFNTVQGDAAGNAQGLVAQNNPAFPTPSALPANSGAQGLRSFDNTVSRRRTNTAGFVDVEADIVKNWTVGGAVRYERYSDFSQSAFTYKVNTRIRVAPWLALRGGFNTGFRAPSIQQQFYEQTTVYSSPAGKLNARVIPSNEDVRTEIGMPALKPETSTSYTGGLVLTPTPDLTLSADFYRIDVKDRILLSGLFVADAFDGKPADEPFREYLVDDKAYAAQFFANAADTRNEGIDLVARYNRPVGRGKLLLSLAANFNRASVNVNVPKQFQDIQNDKLWDENFVDQRPLSMLQTGNPKSKIFASASLEMGKLTVQPRLTRFGEVAYYDNNFGLLEEGGYFLRFTPKYVTDLIVSYHPSKAFMLTVGANNVFNVLPDNKKQAAANGHIPDAAYNTPTTTVAQFESAFRARHGSLFMPYDFDTIPYEAVQMGFNGAFFYLKAAYTLGL
ncbi:TonB-dependent receptor [Hymenobacter rubidus]|uniref:TonB-dependent receptor n=1 Tax=Hymenobacter rubidus TaxID=1441626 RepID=UPI0019202C30|nr:TonB-dependent receptor [Hymenobacter rubidus]